jgi:hypothetical protein
LVLLIRRTARPRGYASGAYIGCGLAGRLFEHPAGLQFQVLATVYLFVACYDRARWKWQRRNQTDQTRRTVTFRKAEVIL